MKLKPLMKDKGGGFMDIFVFMIVTFIVVLVFGVMIFAGFTITDKLHEELDNETTTDNVNYSVIIDDSMGEVNSAYGSFYWLSLFLIFGMIIAIFMGSYMVVSKPVFFIPYIILMIIAVIVSVGISSAYETLLSGNELSATYQNFFGANFIILYLPLWVGVIGFIGGIIMYIRWQQERTYYQ